MTNKRASKGAGSIRQRANGTYEVRVITGRDPATGKEISVSRYCKTKREAERIRTELVYQVQNGEYKEPCKLKLGEWLDIWYDTYLLNVKPRTKESYRGIIDRHIKPNMGAVKLENLTTHEIQKVYNQIYDNGNGVSAKTLKNIHGVLHKALEQAVVNDYIRKNPSDSVSLPRMEKKEIKPLDDELIVKFLKEIENNEYRDLFCFDLFTGLRRGEICGLQWRNVNFAKGTITIDHQLAKDTEHPREFILAPTKTDKIRTIKLPENLIAMLKRIKAQQSEQILKAESEWNKDGFVFTKANGEHVSPHTVYHNYKRIADAIGIPESRMHDLRHSYAVLCLENGDDPKTLQQNLGHSTISTTMNVYAHVSDQMMNQSAERMNQFIQSVKNA